MIATLLCLGLALPAGAQTDARRAAMQAQVRFADLRGGALNQVLPGQPFRVEVTLTSLTGGLPRGLQPMGWIRPVALSDLPCAEAAAAFRATGRGSAGTVDLNGLLLGVLTEDDALTMLDPERNLGTANLIAAERLPERPAAMVADKTAGRFIVSLPKAGQVLALQPMAEPAVLGRGLDAPGALAANPLGGTWVIEGDGDLLLLQDGPARRFARDVRAMDAAGDRLALLGRDVMLLDPAGKVLIRHPAASARAVAALAGDQGRALIWLSGQDLALTWEDAPDRVIRIPLWRSHDGIAVSPAGRFAFAFGGGSEVSVVDLALGRVVQVVGSASPVAEIAFLRNAAVMRTADGTLAGVMDLRMIKPGTAPVVGQFPLGSGPAPSAGAQLLVPLGAEDQVLAVHAAGFTGFVLNATHGTSGKPPMEAIPLRGGIPRIVRALDRGLREDAPGRFVTVARLDQAARYELVISAGLGEAAFCAPLPMPLPAPSPQDLPGTISTEPEDTGIRLRLSDAAGQPVAQARGHLLVTSLVGNWRDRMEFQTDSDGRTRDSYPLPAPPLAIVVESDAARFDPLIME
ncbi:hypothetical protein [Paracoccus sp. S1E-3]|uniref:hypothetical protein n=1 Tax=Paracoccus sp. S1E-3 TaxID=2756130 RepID=UPI001C692C40|nr:hypothetical protein [Paracoccus sp. S1E-3]